MCPSSLLLLLCLLMFQVYSKPVTEIDISPVQSQTEQDAMDLMSRDHFSLDEESYNRLKEKCKQYRLLYASLYNKKVPDEPLLSSILFGDIVATESQVDWLTARLLRSQPHGSHSRRKRKILNYGSYPTKKWSRLIPYTFSQVYPHSETERNYIRESFRIWEKETCVRFKEFNHTESIYPDYVYVERKIGCYSHYGRIGGGQVLGLGPTCFMSDGYGYAIHEIGHAIGLFHEHSRWDRDEYVRIFENNIRHGEEHNFIKFEQSELTTYNMPYDYPSVMHYGSRSFSVDVTEKNTVETIDPLYHMTIGQRYKQSYLDTKAVNLAYCSDICQTSLPCRRGGYQDPNNCRTCKCPDGFQGQLCQDIQDSDRRACPRAGSVDVTSSPSCIRVGPYNDQTQCTWLLKAPVGCQIVFWFEGKFDVLMGITSGPTCLHYVEVQYKGPETTPGPRFCGQSLPDFDQLISDDNEILVNFRTPQFLPEGVQPLGFTMCFKLGGSCSQPARMIAFPLTTAQYVLTTKNVYTPEEHQQSSSYITKPRLITTTGQTHHATTTSPRAVPTTTAPLTSPALNATRMTTVLTSSRWPVYTRTAGVQTSAAPSSTKRPSPEVKQTTSSRRTTLPHTRMDAVQRTTNMADKSVRRTDSPLTAR